MHFYSPQLQMVSIRPAYVHVSPDDPRECFEYPNMAAEYLPVASRLAIQSQHGWPIQFV